MENFIQFDADTYFSNPDKWEVRTRGNQEILSLKRKTKRLITTVYPVIYYLPSSVTINTIISFHVTTKGRFLLSEESVFDLLMKQKKITHHDNSKKNLHQFKKASENSTGKTGNIFSGNRKADTGFSKKSYNC